MKTLATLGPSVRLIVLQFLMPLELTPEIVPPKRTADAEQTGHSIPQVKGIPVLPSTPKVYLLNLLDGICPMNGQGPYELVDSWSVPTLQHFGKCAVRYVFCHKEHVKIDELFPDFVAKRDELIDSLSNLVDDNLWAVQGHLNPYFEKNSRPSNHKVLMLGCAGRQPAVDSEGREIRVYRDGRDQFNQGLGPKVPMSEVAYHLKVVNGDVVLVAPSERVLAVPSLAS